MVLGLLLCSMQTVGAGEGKTGIVDFQKVFDESSVIRALNSELQEKIKSEEEIIASRQDALKVKKDEFDKQQSMLDADVRAEKEDRLRQELKDLQRYAKDKQDEFQRKGAELMQTVMKELTEIVEEIGKKEKYSFVMERSTGGVVYFSDSIEITAEVVKEYDKRYKK
jgi:outer membrane protein